MFIFNFRRLISNNNTAIFCCGLIVFLGLLIETAVEIYFSNDASHIEITLRLIANIFVAGGVLGEVIFAHRVSKEAEEQHRESEQKIAELNNRAGELRERAALLEQQNLRQQKALLEQAEKLSATDMQSTQTYHTVNQHLGVG